MMMQKNQLMKNYLQLVNIKEIKEMMKMKDNENINKKFEDINDLKTSIDTISNILGKNENEEGNNIINNIEKLTKKMEENTETKSIMDKLTDICIKLDGNNDDNENENGNIASKLIELKNILKNSENDDEKESIDEQLTQISKNIELIDKNDNK